MAQSSSMLMAMVLYMALTPLCFSMITNGGHLYPQFYDQSCPKAANIVRSIVTQAVAQDSRMAASLLRLHFHDCFVKMGGPSWEVPAGRRDSLEASLHGSTHNIPAPNNTFQTVLTKFKIKGLDIIDLVALSGSHTMGNTRCTSFKQRLYSNVGNEQTDQSFVALLRTKCPQLGGDQNMFFLDNVTPIKFDNGYYKNLIDSKGLLSSDQILFTENKETIRLVKEYAANEDMFFQQFAKSMVKMGNISPLTGFRGEIKKTCRNVNG